MSNAHELQPEILSPRRPRGYVTAALAAAFGGAIGAIAVGLTAWHVASPTFEPAAITPTPPVPAIAASETPIEIPDIEIAIDETPPLSGRAALIIHGAAPWVALEADAPDAWQTGVPTLDDFDDFSRTLRRDVTAAVPAAYRQMVGTRAFAIDDRGAMCEVTIGDLAIVGRYYGEFEAPETAKERTEAWVYAAPSLAADLSIPDSCGDISWVILPDAGSTAGPAIAAVDTESPMRETIAARLRGEGAWKKVQAEWAASGGTGMWDRHDSLFAVIGGADSGVAVASTGVTGCEAVAGIVTRVWRIRDGALAEAIELPADLHITKIHGAADLNGDGLPEIAIQRGLQSGVLVSDDGRYTAVEGPEILSHICPC
jgi:hypothetical protein